MAQWDHPVRLLVQGYAPAVHEEEDETPSLPSSSLRLALQAEQARLGFTYLSDMEQYLLGRNVDLTTRLNAMGLPFWHPWRRLPTLHLLQTDANRLAGLIIDIYRTFGDRNRPDVFVDVAEPEPILELLPAWTQTRIGTNFRLNAAGCKHADYMSDIGADLATMRGVDGRGAVVAVLDSGADASQGLAGWNDFTNLASPSEQDNNGHGIAMCAIVQAVAPGAELHAYRVTDSGIVLLWDLLAALEAAAIDLGAHVISLSLGLKTMAYTCGRCGGGSNGNQSAVFKRRLDGLERGAGRAGASDPIFVAGSAMTRPPRFIGRLGSPTRTSSPWARCPSAAGMFGQASAIPTPRPPRRSITCAPAAT